MTEYSNPQIPEGINVSSEHPLKDFFLMLSGIGIALVLAIMLLSIFAEQLVRVIPFEVEQALTANLEQWQLSLPDTDSPDDESATAQSTTEEQAYNNRVETYLQQLSNQPASTRRRRNR